mmetsp:Transcript_33582/g.54050  ORF Transcript_33582/g.54050 Transcript_33582/m.54050 type:complete len:103 (+) Transcript_33582:646-954(+)
MRALLAVPLHAATGMIIGLNITGALMQREQPVAYKVLWLPILLHGTYDGLLMITLAIGTSTMQGIALLAFAIPLFAFAYGVRKICKLPVEYFGGEDNQRLLA